MEIHKFKLIQKGEMPIVRVTFKKRVGGWFQKEWEDTEQDFFKSNTRSWYYLHTGRLFHEYESIEAFFKSGRNFYFVGTSPAEL